MTFGILFNSEGFFLSFSQASFFWPSLESRSSLAIKVHIIHFSSFSHLLQTAQPLEQQHRSEGSLLERGRVGENPGNDVAAQEAAQFAVDD